MEQVKELLAQGLEELGLTPPDGAVDKLCRYGALLLEQNRVMNLTAITDPVAVARLHFLDSAALLAYGDGGARAPRPTRAPQACLTEEPLPTRETCPTGEGSLIGKPQACPTGVSQTRPTWLAGKSLIDVGTGAGFPGMVLKILEPSLSLTLVDSLGKRMRWLETICEALSLDGIRCLHARAEELAMEAGFRDSFDLAASRAVAAYPLLCELCLPFVKEGGIFIAMKSVDSTAEVQAGDNAVKRLGGKLLAPVDYTVPDTEITHRLVLAKKIAPTPKGLPRSWGKIKKTPL